jgi:hypothetical protein
VRGKHPEMYDERGHLCAPPPGSATEDADDRVRYLACPLVDLENSIASMALNNPSQKAVRKLDKQRSQRGFARPRAGKQCPVGSM